MHTRSYTLFVYLRVLDGPGLSSHSADEVQELVSDAVVAALPRRSEEKEGQVKCEIDADLTGPAG